MATPDRNNAIPRLVDGAGLMREMVTNLYRKFLDESPFMSKVEYGPGDVGRTIWRIRALFSDNKVCTYQLDFPGTLDNFAAILIDWDELENDIYRSFQVQLGHQPLGERIEDYKRQAVKIASSGHPSATKGRRYHLTKESASG